MFSISYRWIFVLSTAFLLIACDASEPKTQAKHAPSDAKKSGTAKDAAPKPPENGCPLAVTAPVEVRPRKGEYKGKDKATELDLKAYNTSDGTVSNYRVAVRFRDASGEIIQVSGKDFQIITFNGQCKPKSACWRYLPFGPEGAKSADTVIVETLTWPEGADEPKTTWKLDWDSASGKWPG